MKADGELLRIASGIQCGLIEGRNLGSELFNAALRGPGADVAVGKSPRTGDGLRCCATQDEWEMAEGLRRDTHVVVLEVLTDVAEALLVPGSPQDPCDFPRRCADPALSWRIPKEGEFLVSPARSDADLIARPCDNRSATAQSSAKRRGFWKGAIAIAVPRRARLVT